MRPEARAKEVRRRALASVIAVRSLMGDKGSTITVVETIAV